jgi:hypothetical protein
MSSRGWTISTTTVASSPTLPAATMVVTWIPTCQCHQKR